jgi:hypothetical protein
MAMSELSSAKKVWEKLSKVNVNDHVEDKGDFSYLPWNWGWSYMMDNYPSAIYNPLPHEIHPDGTVMTWAEITVEGITRKMYLPVMDYRNKAVPNPNAREINDTQQRCMTKCLALFGLGFYIYKGEGVPFDPKSESVEDGPELANPDEVFFEARDYLFKAIKYTVKSKRIGGSLADLKKAMKHIAGGYSPEIAMKVKPFADSFEKQLTKVKVDAQAA